MFDRDNFNLHNREYVTEPKVKSLCTYIGYGSLLVKLLLSLFLIKR